MANDQLSGPTVLTYLVKWIMQLENPEYSYRIVFIPETIGSITYLSLHYKEMKNKIIDVTNLTKKYSSKDSLALDHVNLTIEQGSIFGLLGPNGAGKSSFINILSGLSNKTSGKVFVCGIDLDEDPKTIRGNIGVVPQEINIDPFFTPLEIMNIQSGMYGVKKKQNNPRLS